MKSELPSKLNFEEIGFKVGIEFHQQLLAPDHRGYSDKFPLDEYGSKLFCPCPAVIRESKPDIRIKRQLRALSGETGEIDISAQFEQKKQQNIIYEAYSDSNCLIELDEEPINTVNPEAIFRASVIAKRLFNLKLVDEVFICRKTIVDGSNVSGFQRTSIIAVGDNNSFIDVDGKKIGVYLACLEEDSAKNIGHEKGSRVFRLDRLGIPLIEIATSPDMKTPSEVTAVALRIGSLLRSTGYVKRGLGTIRQDLNVSITGGSRVEIKGVQELDLLETFVTNEAIRQIRMIELLKELKSRGFTAKHISKILIHDVTAHFKSVKHKLIKSSIEKGNKILGFSLPLFDKLLGLELQPNYRVGTEFSEIAKIAAQAGGIIHSDEISKYGISTETLNQLKTDLNSEEQDGYAILIGTEEMAQKTVSMIQAVLTVWLNGIPTEVRAPRVDGTSGFLRPLPGGARMYPETDLPPISITSDFIERIDAVDIELPEDRLVRLQQDYNLSSNLSEKLVLDPSLEIFEKIVSITKVNPVLVATTMLETIKSLKRDGFELNLSDDNLLELFTEYEVNNLVPSVLLPLLESFSKSPDKSFSELIILEGLTSLDDDQLNQIINEVFEANATEISEKGMRVNYGKIQQ
jgi:glutamyl-tRNA(Gln) amidotransferase subunit E